MVHKDNTSNPIPTSFLKPEIILWAMLWEEHFEAKQLQGWGYLCSLCITCLACILLSLHLVAVVFGTAIPTTLYIFLEMLFTCFLAQ